MMGVEREPDLSVASKAGAILQLARSRSPADRERLLLAVADLYETGGEGQDLASSATSQALLNSIFMSLVVEAELDIRRRLAERLSRATWAPSALINILALDDIEVARPIIAQSPVLQDHDLIRLLIEATLEHQIEVARRPNLRPPVIAAILRQDQPAVLTALAGNLTAQVSTDDLAHLVAAARRVVSLRQPLAQHPALTEALSRELYAWVGQALREGLTTRFALDAPALDAALAASVAEAHAGSKDAPPWPPNREAERQEMERRMIAKLDIAGQLRPGYLLRALQDGKLSLFICGLATLGRFEIDEVRRAVNADQAELLLLACAAVGIDRSTFPTIVALVQDLNGGRPGDGKPPRGGATGGFVAYAPDVASAAFRQAVLQV